jgi:hypothetical protein
MTDDKSSPLNTNSFLNTSTEQQAFSASATPEGYHYAAPENEIAAFENKNYNLTFSFGKMSRKIQYCIQKFGDPNTMNIDLAKTKNCIEKWDKNIDLFFNH